MADGVNQLFLQLELRQDKLEKSFAKGQATIAKRFGEMQSTTSKASKRIESDMQSAALAVDKSFGSLGASVAGLTAALSVREVARYADAWTGAKNSLAVAGVVGAQQVDILDRLYQSAQANATPIKALADLYGKAAQASDNLGASQTDLVTFSDGVAVALRVAGTGADQASGALTQLGQLLGSARVQAEEFNSVNEGARPILIAVANGLDAAGGSVNRLKQLVNAGEVSGREFFQAFIRGLPTIQAMAANSTQTIAQGITKVDNALTKYIGSTDSSLGASRRLVAGLNALADNFSEVADVTLQVASVIAGALVGRSITGLIAKLALGTAATLRFAGAMRAALSVFMSGGIVSGFGALSAAAGPLGLVIGGAVVGALALFANGSVEAAERSARVTAELEKMGLAGHEAADGIDAVSAAQNRLPTAETIADNAKKADDFKRHIDDLRGSVDNLIVTFEPLSNPLNLSVTGDAARKVLEFQQRLEEGSISLDDFKGGLDAVARTQPSFAPAIASLKALQGEIFATISALGMLGNTSSGPNVVEDRLTRASLDPSLGAVRTGQAFIADAQRRNTLSRDQLALEEKIATVRKRAEASGGIVTDGQITKLAEDEIAGDKRRQTEGRSAGGGGSRGGSASAAKDENDAVKDLIASLEEELRLVGATDAERAVANNLRSAGASATEQQKGRISELTLALRQQETAQERANSAAEAVKSVGQDALRGLIDDLRNGASAADALTGALDRVIDRLLDMALDQAFGGLNLGSISLGVLGAPAAGGVFAEGGDIRGPGTGTSDSIPIWASNGEFMVNAKAAAKHRRLLHAINDGSAGFAAGGDIGTLPDLAIPTRRGGEGAGSGAQTINISAPISVAGSAGTPEQNADLAAQMGRQLESTMRGVVAEELLRQTRAGNSLNNRWR